MKNKVLLSLAAAALPVLASCDLPLPEQYELASPSSLPEGLAYDDLTYSFFATAINGGQITRISALGQEHVFYAATDPLVSFSGAHVDPARRLLWVCQVDVKTDPIPNSKVVAFDIDAGSLVRSIDLGEPSFCNDLTTDEDGAVYATDSALPNIYRIGTDDQLEVFASSPLFVPGGSIGLNGLGIAPGGEDLLVVKTMPPALYRVSLADPSDITEVTFFGDAFSVPGDPRFPGPDGIEFLGDELYVIYDGGVQQLTFDGDDHTHAEVKTTTEVPTGLTSATVAEGRLYAIDSEVYRVLYMFQPPVLPFKILHLDEALFDGP
jgi:sugar lactone lactonase YvrE